MPPGASTRWDAPGFGIWKDVFSEVGKGGSPFAFRHEICEGQNSNMGPFLGPGFISPPFKRVLFEVASVAATWARPVTRQGKGEVATFGLSILESDFECFRPWSVRA